MSQTDKSDTPIRAKILAVDDNRAIHTSLSASFEGTGLGLSLVSSVDDAMTKLAHEKFDVLISDIWLPDEAGIYLIKFARKAHPLMKVYAITGGGPGMSTESAASLAVIWGADRVFLKPFDEKLLIYDIKSALEIT